MPLVKEWIEHFQTLNPEQRAKLIAAIDDLATDSMMQENYKDDLRELKYALTVSGEKAEEVKTGRTPSPWGKEPPIEFGKPMTPEQEERGRQALAAGQLAHEAEQIVEYRRRYAGDLATLDGEPAHIQSIEGGGAAAIISSKASGEASWFKVHEVMTQRAGAFTLSRGHLAV